MPDLSFLRDLVVVFAAAVIVVALLRRIHIPSIAGFILTGTLVGPGALGLIHDSEEVEALAEVGVVLLMFGIGLELSLDRLKRLWKPVLVGGTLQLVLTVLATTAVAYGFDLPLGAAIFLGCVIAVSSTAIVLRGLSARGELDAPHGRLALGILVFQDLSVVPMILALPFLAGTGGSRIDALRTAGMALLVLGGVVVGARVVVPRLLGFVAKTRQRDLFILSVFLICFGTAWSASTAGISLALGAFLGGLVVAGSEFRHQALSDLLPTRLALAALFFVSVGMLLHLGDFVDQVGPTLGLLAAILTGKFIIVLLTSRVLRLPLRVGIQSAMTLCQVGEFSFVLLRASAGTHLLEGTLRQNLLAAIILSMLVTPLLIALGPHLASGAVRVPWLHRLLGIRAPGEDRRQPRANHVIVAGCGPAGQAMVQVLAELQIENVAVDLNPENVRRIRERGQRGVLADVTQPEVLEELGVHEARMLVLAINDLRAAERTTRAARHLAPDLPILVRTQYVDDEAPLRKAGANWVVTAETQATTALVSIAREELLSESHPSFEPDALAR